ncbi:glycosyltransferase [Methylosinus sp. Ce-a6]|uniref:glycosyltransferase n=1 Tax=Methylosinus sp. Ce-a6 TaxID=2172005 RepID=UPI00135C9B60|nr:glycosyltransferase [Methylosinus sp. Ce-a6]
MSRLLLVTKKIAGDLHGGRELLLALNRDCLQEIFEDDLFVVELESAPVRTAADLVAAMSGHIDGVNEVSLRAIVRMVREKEITQVFIDGSNMGVVASALKRQNLPIKITTFFHNVEARFFLGAFYASRTLRALLVLVANYVAERKAVKNSDVIVTLSEADSRVLYRTYGRRASLIWPMAVRDKMKSTLDSVVPASLERDPYLLFVGSAFYANKAGILWFVDNVAPHIRMETVIIGRGMDAMKPRLERSGKVRVIGSVEDLGHWYLGANIIIAPIFDGSGMKTKVAEALMFGKKILGTPQAFSGYEDVAARVGWVCKDSEDFVATLNSLSGLTLPAFDPQLRALYESRYSFPAARARHLQALGDR